MFDQMPIIECIASSSNFTPERHSHHAAGYDLRANIDIPLTIYPQHRVPIPTGIRLKPRDHSKIAGLIIPRSGLGTKHDIVLANLVGLIDPDYEGEIIVTLRNIGSLPYTIEPEERIAQIIFLPFVTPAFYTVETFTTPSSRGTLGFGSSGRF